MPPPLLLALARRGVTVTAEEGRLGVRPAAALTDADRAALRAGKAELLAYLTPPAGAWDIAAVRTLTADADALVERLGVSCTHPDLRPAAKRAAEAIARRDMAALVRAVRAFELLVHRLAVGPAIL